MADLQALDLSPTFDTEQPAIIMRSVCSDKLSRGRERLEGLMKDIRLTTVEIPKIDAIRDTNRAPLSQRVSVHPQPEILALDPEEDADIISFWNRTLLKIFPSFVRDARIGGTYSVALVRQKLPDGLRPIIRFRSAANQTERSRQIIRSRVKDVCVEKGLRTQLHVQFTVSRQ